ncbi:MAG: hypothetical protein OXS29_05710 [bacterium]|nr:hypothetical protein [bacterium]MDE0440420.1 hypothetical protein [bacterium]
MSNLLAAANIDHRRAPHLGAPPALPPEQGLINSHSLDLADPIAIRFQQRFTPPGDFVGKRCLWAARNVSGHDPHHASPHVGSNHCPVVRDHRYRGGHSGSNGF